eukprot:111029_1
MTDYAETKEEIKEENSSAVKLQQDIVDTVEYGFLKNLAGTWINQKNEALGLNIISLPAPGLSPTATGAKVAFTPLIFPYTETLNFTLSGGARNRGGLNEQFNGVVQYNQIVKDTKGKVQHVENGMYLFLDNIHVGLNKGSNKIDSKDDNKDDNKAVEDVPFKPKFAYCRSGTVPHGNSLMLFGNELVEISGPPKFDKVIDILNPVDPAGTMGKTGQLGYTERLTYPGNPLQPITTLQNAIKGQKIINTITLQLSASNQGTIVNNTPFIKKFANATEMDFVLWLETVEENDGTYVLQLQYAQRIMLEFGFTTDGKTIIKWPHITVNTLRLKQ